MVGCLRNEVRGSDPAALGNPASPASARMAKVIAQCHSLIVVISLREMFFRIISRSEMTTINLGRFGTLDELYRLFILQFETAQCEFA